ncbi:MAG: RND transporter, partial [Acidobacteriota bacterium]
MKPVCVAVLLTIVLLTIFVAGCSVGPKYQRPSLQAPTAYKEPPPEAYKESEGWKTAQPSDAKLRGDWRTLFG